VIAGRPFERTDVEGSPPVATVNEAFARRYFPGGSALGETIEIGRFRGEFIDPSLEGPGVRIVGVVGDIREVSLRAEPRRTMYVPQSQAHTRISNVLGGMPVFIARPTEGGDAARTLSEAVRSADPGLPEPDVFPLDEVVVAALARERFGAALLTGFAALALFLTAFGIYGALAYSVRQRRREIGIRMALGAGGHEVARLVVAQGLGPVVAGLLLGVAGALALSRVVAGYLWGVTPNDPATLATVAAVLLAVALLASWMPAREAVRLDPVDTLNGE
jgi:putative ABC transport system permease protein